MRIGNKEYTDTTDGMDYTDKELSDHGDATGSGENYQRLGIHRSQFDFTDSSRENHAISFLNC